jgi:hypothetical protein
MRVGLILCGRLPDRYAGISGDYPSLVSDMFENSDISLAVFDSHLGSLPLDVAAFDGIIISGSLFTFPIPPDGLEPSTKANPPLGLEDLSRAMLPLLDVGLVNPYGGTFTTSVTVCRCSIAFTTSVTHG